MFGGQNQNKRMDTDRKLTWTHIVRATASKCVADLDLRGEAKVGEVDVLVVEGAHDVLRFEITVVDTAFVAPMQSVDELHESLLHPCVVSFKDAVLDDCPVEIATRAIIHDEILVTLFGDDVVQSDDAGKSGDGLVQEDLAVLNTSIL